MPIYQVEKDVPVPGPRAKAIKYPFRAMNVGDSFRVPLPEDVRVRTAVADYNRRYKPQRFVSRKIIDTKSRSHIRIWRIA